MAPRPDCRRLPQSSPEAGTAKEEHRSPMARSLDLHVGEHRPGLTQPHEWGVGLPIWKSWRFIPAEKAPSVTPRAHLGTHGGARGQRPGSLQRAWRGGPPFPHQGNGGGEPSSQGPGATLHGLCCPILSHTTSPRRCADGPGPARRRHNQPAPAGAELPAGAAGPRKPPEDTAPRPSVDVMELTVPCCPSRRLSGVTTARFPPWLVQGQEAGLSPAPSSAGAVPAPGLWVLPVPEQMLCVPPVGARK